TYGEGTSLIDNPNRYDEKVTLYDKMGNIENLERHGKADGTNVFGIIDNLTYAYTGNKLTKVTDSATLTTTYYGAFQFVDGANDVTEYTYDANGNLKKDYNKKIVDIAYNSLNLPDGLQFTNGNTTMYTYDATGNKLSVTHQTAVAGITIPMSSEMITLTPEQIYSSFKTDYCGNMIYENGELSKILTEEGYITFSGSTPVYHYYLRDHQGNNRVVLNQSGTVEQVNHYYPFGGLFGESTNIETQPYKYNGKEFDGMYGLNLFDYGARHYDAALGRWMVVDPLTEGYYNISPYAYVGNNPVYFIDLDGREVVISGTLSDEALRQLQDRMQNRITLTRNAESGKLSYTVNEGQKLKGYAKRMANMIDNQSITVNLITTDKNETSTGNLMVGGAFMGNTVTTDANGNKAVVANQEVNPNVLGSADTHTKTAGKMMMHEATEAYAGAQLSQKSGVSAAPATQADANNPRSVYMRAHNKATSQTPVSQTLYDRNGNVTTDVTQAVRVEWSVTRGSRSKVIQTYP
ncbi:MAG: RHS repeat-associated core domain-containing protein, partial [Dysgonamonadaceae bacterium]|nr:RHS repeat-associated core domain-containing protein [Dysgonamonadaceae bacterium]